MTRDDDARLLRALRELAADYEPKVEAIANRVRTMRPADHAEPILRPVHATPQAGSAATGVRTGLRSAVRVGRPVLLPAAVVLLVGGIVLVTSSGAPDPRSGQAVAVATQTAAAAVDSEPDGGSTIEPERGETTRLASPARSPRPTRNSPTAPSSATAPATPAEKRAEISVRRATPGAAVELVRPPLLDWLAVGTRSDLKQIRAKASATDPVLALAQPGSAASVTGVFTTTWTAGIPEQDRDGATDWLQAEARPGLIVTIAASGEPRTVRLYAGTRDLRGTLEVSGKGVATERINLDPTGDSPQGITATVTLPPTTGPTQLRLSGFPDGPDPHVFLAAATATATG